MNFEMYPSTGLSWSFVISSTGHPRFTLETMWSLGVKPQRRYCSKPAECCLSEFLIEPRTWGRPRTWGCWEVMGKSLLNCGSTSLLQVYQQGWVIQSYVNSLDFFHSPVWSNTAVKMMQDQHVRDANQHVRYIQIERERESDTHAHTHTQRQRERER